MAWQLRNRERNVVTLDKNALWTAGKDGQTVWRKGRFSMMGPRRDKSKSQERGYDTQTLERASVQTYVEMKE